MMIPIAIFAIAMPAAGLYSPNGGLCVNQTIDVQGRRGLTIALRGKKILDVGQIGLVLTQGGPLGSRVDMVGESRRSVDETYPMPTGKCSQVRNNFNELTVRYAEPDGLRRRFELVIRAYDDGVAFRYFLPVQEGINRFDLVDELTEFKPSGNPKAFALILPHFRTPYEEHYAAESIKSIKDGTLIGLPLGLIYKDVAAVITEADLDDYAGMYLVPQHGGLVSRLAPRTDGSGLAVRAELPHCTPWRVVAVSSEPAKLAESNIVLNLNPPSRIADTSWIKPGKTTFPWWNGYNTDGAGFTGAQDTRTHEWYIDFCAKHGFPYHSLDGLDNIAWYGGTIVPYEGADITKSLPGLDFDEILRHAKEKGVRIRLWMNSAAAAKQMDVAFPFYQRKGIEGIMVDFFDRDDQDTVNLVRRIMEKAAECRLTVILHNIYKPTGLSRTYPNLMTVEAARNLEFDKWDPAGISPEHELIIPFFRMLAGPVDFHSGSFRNVSREAFKPVDKAPMTIGTRARQLARYVVYEGALPMVADSPAVYESQKGLDFLASVPTVWDETRAIAGKVGEYAVVARRYRNDWYLGAMTNSSARTLKIKLDFLSPGRYSVKHWADGRTETDLKTNEFEVKRGDIVTIAMSPAGGAALEFHRR